METKKVKGAIVEGQTSMDTTERQANADSENSVQHKQFFLFHIFGALTSSLLIDTKRITQSTAKCESAFPFSQLDQRQLSNMFIYLRHQPLPLIAQRPGTGQWSLCFRPLWNCSNQGSQDFSLVLFFFVNHKGSCPLLVLALSASSLGLEASPLFLSMAYDSSSSDQCSSPEQ